jgi:peptidoglycan hydrolase-like protein with peptidoglycan-binding domain
MKKSISWIYLGVFCLTFFSFSYAAKLPLFTSDMVAKIQYGKKSTPTKNLQVALNSLGYSVAESGPGSEGKETDMYDQNLTKAIKEFQAENELTVTGKLDAPTVKVLNQLIKFLNDNDTSDQTTLDKTYSSDISDNYMNQLGLNKDFFQDDPEHGFFENGARTAVDYTKNALQNYADIDITGQKGISGKDTLLGQKGGNVQVVPQKDKNALTLKPSGNVFQDAIAKTIVGNAAVLFYNTFVLGKSSAGVTEVKTVSTKRRYTDEEIKQTVENITTDGKFDPFKCIQDPICSKY